MSKELTVEAKNFIDAIEMVRAMMAEPIPYKEFTPTRVFYDDVRKDGKQFTVG
jgi:hypothetical protein